jgi:hypothetical protein
VHIEERLRKRLLRPALMILLVVTALVLPTWLWVVRGRTLPLEVVLDPPVFVVKASSTVPLRPTIRPQREDLVPTWEGLVVRNSDGQHHFKAPDKSGLYTVTIKVRRSGSTVKDSVTFQVVADEPGSYSISRPPAPDFPPDLPPCPAPVPARARIHGRPCKGATVVVETRGAPRSTIWHWLDEHRDQASEGRSANLLLGDHDDKTSITSLIVAPQGNCAWSSTTVVAMESCRARPGSKAVLADFSWQMVGPGHFRFAAKPSRTPGVFYTLYHWDFGDGVQKETKSPLVAHRFKGPPRRWHRVTLRVEADKETAESVRAVMDRSVTE